MDILDINTDDLRKYVSMAKKANTNINEAYKLLDKIVKHEDWICPQRDDLITYTNKNKSEINIGFQIDSNYILRCMMTLTSIMDS